jgi:hypothetical protein
MSRKTHLGSFTTWFEGYTFNNSPIVPCFIQIIKDVE